MRWVPEVVSVTGCRAMCPQFLVSSCVHSALKLVGRKDLFGATKSRIFL